MPKYFQSSALLPIALIATGCAGFQAHNLPIAQDVEYKSTKAEKLKVFSRWKIESTTGPLVNRDIVVAMYKKSFERVITESGCCDIVESSSEAALVIDGTAVDHSNVDALVPTVITGLSLYTIPSWVTETIDLKVNAKSGQRENSYRLNDSFTLVQWLPMAFAFPFKGGPAANIDELNSNTYKNLIIHLKQDGHL